MRTVVCKLNNGLPSKVFQISTLLFLGLVLSGCETANSLLTSAGFSNASNTTSTPVVDQTSSAPQLQRAQISVAPVVGPPDDTSRALQSKISSSLQAQKVSVANQFTDPSEFTLRGYVVAAKEKSSVKISYIWDITDPSGKRINRVSGEELAAANSSTNDIWSAVSPQIIDKISSKTVSSVVAWLPSQTQISASTPIDSSSVASQVNAVPLPVTQKEIQSTTIQSGPQATSQIPSQSTGSISPTSSASVTTSVSQVIGAPGDGGVALSEAIQRELSKSGISLSTNNAKAYKVAGVVSVGAPKDGKQPVTIDWNVQDPSGKKLGTVSQKNEVAQGSLDGAWGKTADAAAAAAAQGIIKLLPKTN